MEGDTGRKGPLARSGCQAEAFAFIVIPGQPLREWCGWTLGFRKLDLWTCSRYRGHVAWKCVGVLQQWSRPRERVKGDGRECAVLGSCEQHTD